jgi:hypothetical protein
MSETIVRERRFSRYAPDFPIQPAAFPGRLYARNIESTWDSDLLTDEVIVRWAELVDFAPHPTDEAY